MYRLSLVCGGKKKKKEKSSHCESFVFPFICMEVRERKSERGKKKETFWFTLSICCSVAKAHIALQISVNIHSLKEKEIWL